MNEKEIKFLKEVLEKEYLNPEESTFPQNEFDFLARTLHNRGYINGIFGDYDDHCHIAIITDIGRSVI